MATKIKPLNDKVLLKLVEAQNKTSSGMFLPESASDEQYLATVIAVGPGKLTDKGEKVVVSVKEGQTVIIRGKWAGDSIVHEGQEYKIVSDSDILAVVE